MEIISTINIFQEYDEKDKRLEQIANHAGAWRTWPHIHPYNIIIREASAKK